MTVKCLIDHARQVRYIPIPKNANTTLIAALFGLRGTPERIHTRRPALEKWTPDGPPTFAVLRDPLERLESTWRNKVWRPHRPDTALIVRHGMRAGMPFDAFVRRVEKLPARGLDIHIRPQVLYLPTGDDLAHVTLLRVGHLAEDADGTCAAFLRDINLTPRNVSRRGADVWTDILRQRAAALYGEDMELWERLNATRTGSPGASPQGGPDDRHIGPS